MASAFWQARLTAVEAQIVAVEGAIDVLTAGTVQSYELDTGQSRQRVTKFDLPKLNGMLDSLLNRYATLQARCSGTGVGHARPVS